MTPSTDTRTIWSWEEQKRRETAMVRKMRSEWMEKLAAMNLGVAGSAREVGLCSQHIRRVAEKLGTKIPPRKFEALKPAPRKMEVHQIRALRSELNDRVRALKAAGYKPDYAKKEAFRGMMLSCEQAIEVMASEGGQ